MIQDDRIDDSRTDDTHSDDDHPQTIKNEPATEEPRKHPEGLLGSGAARPGDEQLRERSGPLGEAQAALGAREADAVRRHSAGAPTIGEAVGSGTKPDVGSGTGDE